MCYGAAFTMPGSFIRTKRSRPPSNTACSTTDLVRLCLCEFTLKNSISGMKDLAMVLGISFNDKFYKFCILEILFYTFYSNRNEKKNNVILCTEVCFCSIEFVISWLYCKKLYSKLGYFSQKKGNLKFLDAKM